MTPADDMQKKIDHTCKRMATMENEVAKMLHKSTIESEKVFGSYSKPLRPSSSEKVINQKDWGYLDNVENNNLYNFAEMDENPNTDLRLSELKQIDKKGPSASLLKSL
jgi:hypothetical protein